MIKIICENGVNFKNMKEAKLMIKKAKEIGAWGSKFQIYNDDLIKDHPQKEFLKSIMINAFKMIELLVYGDKIHQMVFFTPMFEEAIDWCQALSVPIFKVRFKDSNPIEGGDFPKILEKCVRTGKPTFMSTFTSRIGVFNFLPFNLYPIYCVPSYPADLKDYDNIDFKIFRGISDHVGNLDLLKKYIKFFNKDDVFADFYYEKHVCLTKDCLESKWSCTFDQLREVLKQS